MFINDILSSKPVPSRYIRAGANEGMTRLNVYRDGPKFFQDPSEGSQVQLWRFRSRDYWARLQAPNYPEIGFLPNPENLITDLSFCFNQNADVHYMWIEQGDVYWCWYDSTVSRMAIRKMPAGTRSAMCVLDDTRDFMSGRSDIILAYISGDGKLKFCKQRDRFGIDYTLSNGPFISLERLYMNAVWRLQFECVVGAAVTPAAPIFRTYSRFIFAPKIHSDYTGFKNGVFDTGYVVPTNQTVDGTASQLTGLYWEIEDNEALITVEFDNKPVATELPYFYLWINGLKIQMFRLADRTYAAQLNKLDTVQLLRTEERVTNVALEFPDVTNVTQEL